MLTAGDKELIKLMKQETENFCEKVIYKFRNGAYIDDEVEIAKNIEQWRLKKQRVDELCKELTNYLKNS